MPPAGLILALTLTAAWFGPGLAAQSRVINPHVVISLVTERSAVMPGGSLQAALRFKVETGWHIYWRNPGQAGIATQAVWKLPTGWTADTLSWPVPARYDVAGTITHIHRGDVVFGTRFTVPATASGTARVAVSLTYGICRDVCMPGEAELGLLVPVGVQGTEPAEWRRVSAIWEQRSPRPGGPLVEATVQDSVLLLTLRGEGGGPPTPGVWTFFPADRAVASAAVSGRARPQSRELVLQLPLGQCIPTRLDGILVQGDPTVPLPQGFVVSAPLSGRPTC